MLAELQARGGDVAELRGCASDTLTARLKELGFTKIGERMRIAQALQQQPPHEAAREVRDWVDLSGDGGLLKEVLRGPNPSGLTPPLPSRVKVRIVGTLVDGGARFDCRVAEWILGEQQLIRGLEKGVATMTKGEVALFELRADYAYGDEGKPPAVPPAATVRYEVEVLSWVEPKKSRAELTRDERVDEAARLKEDGARAYGAKAWLAAQVAYHDAASLLLDEAPEGFESLGELCAPRGREDEAHALLTSCWLNEAQCALQREEWFCAADACTRVLRKLADPLGRERAQHVKALFRRATALARLSEFERARADLREANRLEPSNRQVRELWGALREREQGAKAALRQVESKMTSRALYRELLVAKPKRSGLPRVWFDVAIGAERAGRITFELFAHKLPRTAENFRALCTGERGVSAHSGRPLHYKGSTFHRALSTDDGPAELLAESDSDTARKIEVWKGMFVQGGDILHGDGTGPGESIYGPTFADEAFEYRHGATGLLSMAGTPPMRDRAGEERMHRPDSNHSQFFITTKARTSALGGMTMPHLDRRHVVFGKVVKGMEVVHRINRLPVGKNHLIATPVVIVDCGECRPADEDHQPAPGDAAEVEAEEGRCVRADAYGTGRAEEARQTVASGDPASIAGVPGCREAERDDDFTSAEVDDDVDA